MSRNSGVSVCAALVAIAICIPAPARADDKRAARPMPCADLVQLSLPDTLITSAVEMPAGPFPFSGSISPTCCGVTKCGSVMPDRALQAGVGSVDDPPAPAGLLRLWAQGSESAALGRWRSVEFRTRNAAS